MKSLWFLITFIFITSASAEQINTLKIMPYSEDGETKGYITVSREIKMAAVKLTYYISKCDLNLKPITTITEQRYEKDAVASFAYNKTSFCFVFATEGNLEICTYSKDLKLLKKISFEGKGMWEKIGAIHSTITANSENGFILSRYSMKDKQVCKFMGLDNNLNTLWEYTSSLDNEGLHVTPLLYPNLTDQYFYNFFLRKKKTTQANGQNSGILINNVSDGSLATVHYFNKPGMTMIDYPALTNAGKENLVFAIGGFYNMEEKNRGLVLAKMDLTAKKSSDLYLLYSSPEFTGKLDASAQQVFADKNVSIQPFELIKSNNKLIMIGEVFSRSLKDLSYYGTTGCLATHIVICEFDQNLTLQKIILHSKKDGAAPSWVVRDHKALYYPHSIQEVLPSGDNNLTVKFVDYLSDASADYCIASYKEGNFKVEKKKTISKDTNTALNIYDGEQGKINVIRVTNQALEIALEDLK